MRGARMARITLSPYGGAKRTRQRAKTIAGVLGADVVEKCNVPAPGRRITLCMRKTGKPGPKIKSPFDVCKVMRNMGLADRESFYVLHLDVRGNVNGIAEVAKGSLTGVEVHPREIFKRAVLNNAASIIGVHNHPSGDAKPSGDDKELTRRLIGGGKLLGIPMQDHIIIGEMTRSSFGCHSMRDKGDVSGFGNARKRR